jgi:hypothetical protein
MDRAVIRITGKGLATVIEQCSLMLADIDSFDQPWSEKIETDKDNSQEIS